MKKSLFLTSGFAMALLCSSCEKAAIGPNPSTLPGTQQAETPIDFHVLSGKDNHWQQQYILTGSESSPASCQLTVADSQLIISTDDNSSTEKPMLHFVPALSDEAVITVEDAENNPVFEAPIAKRTTEYSLSAITLPEGSYTLSITTQGRRIRAAFVNHYIVQTQS